MSTVTLVSETTTQGKISTSFDVGDGKVGNKITITTHLYRADGTLEEVKVEKEVPWNKAFERLSYLVVAIAIRGLVD
jgi:hypothetical protein